jgi:glycerol-3-phosphate dehydrogenase (NAD(P)+)
MKVFTFGIGMFGFAVLNHISDNEKHQFFAYEKSEEVSHALIEDRKHPYFFQDTILNPRVQIVSDYSTVLPEMDLVLMIIPYQFLRGFMEEIQPFLKPGVILVNLSKGINNTTFTTA